MYKKIISVLLIFMVVTTSLQSAILGATHTHSYSGATCTSPKKCSCGATSGSALGHSYSIAATCTSAAKCSRCSSTSGSPLGHSYSIAATCTSAARCSRCTSTNGSALGHTYFYAYESAHPHKGYTKCSRCGDWWYNGKTYSDANCCTCSGHKYTDWNEYYTSSHPHSGYMVCSRGCTVSTGHTFTASSCCVCVGHNMLPATCTEGGKCSRCRAPGQGALGHNYTTPTCTTGSTCSRCGIIGSIAPGHTLYSVTSHQSSSTDFYYVACSVCSTVIYYDYRSCVHHSCSYSYKQYGGHTSTGHDISWVCSCGSSYYAGYKEAYSGCLSCTTAPTVAFANINADTVLSEQDTDFKVQIYVKDNENDNLTCKYYLDDSLTPLGTETASQTSQTKLVTFLTGINVNTPGFEEKIHTIRVEVRDSIAPVGTATTTFKVDKANPVITGVNINSYVNSATINVTAFDATAGLDINAYKYSINGTSSQWLSQSVFDSSSLNITLSPNTNYSYMVQVKDKKGHVASSEGTFCTKSQIPVIVASSTSNNYIDVNINDNNPTDTEYLIKVGSKYVGTNGEAIDSPCWLTLPAKKSSIVGLSADTNYQVEVKSRNRAGVESEYGQASSIATLPLPPNAPINICSSNSSRSAITLYWEAVERATGYDIEKDGNTQELISTDINTFFDDGLIAGSTHSYRIRANIGIVKGEWSELKQFTTLPNPPEKISIASINHIVSGSAIILIWTPTNNTDEYQVELNSNSAYLTSTVSSISIPYTRYNEQYSLRIRGSNAGGFGEWIDSPYITYTPVNKPDAVTISAITFNTVSVNWESNGNPDSVRYKVGIFDLADNIVKESSITTSTQSAISGLVGDTTYILKVKAINSVGAEINWTDAIVFKTKLNPPSTPEQVCATSKDKHISLFWEESNGAEHYQLKRDGVVIAENLLKPNYVDTGLTPSSSYTYQVCAVNESGQSTWSNPLSKSTLGELPETPTGITVTPYKTSISIIWNTVQNVTGYELEVDGKLVSTELLTTYEHNGLSPDSYHTYRVRARNIIGRSEWSQPVTKQTIPSLPQVPQGVSALATDSTLQIFWNDVATANKYELEIDGALYTDVFINTFKLTGLAAETEHTYKVRAVNDGGSSEWSQAGIITLLASPANAPVLSGTATNNSIALSWNDVADAIGYEILDEFTGTTTTVAAITEYTQNNINSGETHTYKIRAIFESEHGAFSIPLAVATIPDIPIVNTVGEQNTILIEWSEPNGANVYQLEADGEIVYTGSNPRYMQVSLQSDTEHSYRVRAGNDSGFSNWSDITKVKTKKENSNTPMNLIQSKVSNNTLIVSWDSVEGVTEYKIRLNNTEIQQTVSVPYFSITTTPGAIYTIDVAAVLDNQIGTIGEWSEKLTFSTPYDIPISPVLGPTNSFVNSIELKWSEVEHATGYEVESDGQINTIGNSTTYIDSGLVAGSSHMYRVRAYNQSGKGAWSEVLTVSTNADLPGVPLNVYCNNISSTTGASIKINWKEVGGAQNYDVETIGGETTNITGTSIAIDNLNHGTTYLFRVRAITEGGTGPWSSIIRCTTTLETPTNIVSTSSNGVINLTWDQVKGATEYCIEMDGNIIGTTTDSAISITEGSLYITHKFRVKAHNDVQTSDWSDISEYNQEVPVSFEVTEGEEFSVDLPASNVLDINQYRLSLTISKDEVELLDACEITPELDTYTQYIQENCMQLLIEETENSITIIMVLEVGTSEGYVYSGTLNSLKLRSKKNGTISVTYKVDCLK